ncbi:hypothetical protein Tco_0772137 [Tanacetum coccineum]|uniref:Retrovirus-related Pol polyprotein from transposon TNT 1-94 n=1 Tax=Tanacetum coccineum TaxID=301880 RepID=A0ABQ4ZJ19_9ASTR
MDNLEVIGYSDSDFAKCKDSSRSTSGYIFMLSGGPISWISREQEFTTTSTMMAEYVACYHAASHAILLRNLVSRLKVGCINSDGRVAFVFLKKHVRTAVEGSSLKGNGGKRNGLKAENGKFSGQEVCLRSMGPFCMWRKQPPKLSKKSNSTCFPKLWRLKDKVGCSNSDGRDAFVFLKKPVRSAVEGSSLKGNGGKRKGLKAENGKFLGHEVCLRSMGPFCVRSAVEGSSLKGNVGKRKAENGKFSGHEFILWPESMKKISIDVNSKWRYLPSSTPPKDNSIFRTRTYAERHKD